MENKLAAAEENVDVLVVGGGPAGLMAAEAASAAGASVIVADRMPSMGRKFLMAGKSGLNLTKDEPLDRYLTGFGTVPSEIVDILSGFGPKEAQAWARDLGQDIFTGSTGRVFPKVMKASPLLRAQLVRLGDRRVELRTRWSWTGWDNTFDTPTGLHAVRAKATVLALGGATWSRLGSDGKWTKVFDDGELVPFAPSNTGLRIEWSDKMERHFGAALKAVAFKAGKHISRGECIVTEKGLEGGGVYHLTPSIRTGEELVLDLCPDVSVEQVRAKLARPKGKASLSNHLRKSLRLEPVKIALLHEFARPFAQDIAPSIKALRVRLDGLAPLDEAISSRGGVAWSAVSEGLMLKQHPGFFVAGEMIEWEAPTGGYLINAALAMGLAAGQSAARFAQSS